MPESKTGRAAFLEHNIPPRLAARTVWAAWVRIRNTGRSAWSNAGDDRVDLVVSCDGQVRQTHPLPRTVAEGEEATVHFALRAPEEEGAHALRVDLVQQGVAAFADGGGAPLDLELQVDPGPEAKAVDLSAEAARLSPWHYQPAGGVHQARDGVMFPVFASRAQGCRLWDVDGREYIDYVMGWGSALPGYAHPRVQDALLAVLESGAVLPLPHPLELDVARGITRAIPSAERVMLGKNGSDVCTLAARLSRAYTGRRVILSSGYHGWQDFWAEHAGFGKSGIPERPWALIHRFRANDLEGFRKLLDRHGADLAAVMIEPAGSVEGEQGPLPDADAAFLSAVAADTRAAGGLLVFDEVLSGFRYPKGSVQAATGVLPDLTCLGKALGGGMPVSALAGRAAVFEAAMERTHYGPTYRGEIYSLAAAAAALKLYEEEPVADAVWRYGTRLRDGLDEACRAAGVAASCIGPPFRMLVAFDEPDAERLRLKRTLYHQELMRAGVLTLNGFMLPSYAHDDTALQATLDAAGRALRAVAAAGGEDGLRRAVEIPLV
jgi:glutamate-1-semialdehyde 2,1-aminomutase